jgi:hypothetical protein
VSSHPESLERAMLRSDLRIDQHTPRYPRTARCASSIASFTQQFWNSPRCTLPFSDWGYFHGPQLPSATTRCPDWAAVNAATTGNEPPLPGSTGARPHVSMQVRPNASKPRPDASTRYGLSARHGSTDTSAPQIGWLRRCLSSGRTPTAGRHPAPGECLS